MYSSTPKKVKCSESAPITTNRVFKRLSQYINKQVVDLDNDALDQRAEVHFDKDDQVMLGYVEGETDPFTNPRMSFFDHVAAAGDPDKVARIKDAIKSNKSVDKSTDTSVENE